MLDELRAGLRGVGAQGVISGRQAFYFVPTEAREGGGDQDVGNAVEDTDLAFVNVGVGAVLYGARDAANRAQIAGDGVVKGDGENVVGGEATANHLIVDSGNRADIAHGRLGMWAMRDADSVADFVYGGALQFVAPDGVRTGIQQRKCDVRIENVVVAVKGDGRQAGYACHVAAPLSAAHRSRVAYREVGVASDVWPAMERGNGLWGILPSLESIEDILDAIWAVDCMGPGAVNTVDEFAITEVSGRLLSLKVPGDGGSTLRGPLREQICKRRPGQKKEADQISKARHERDLREMV